MLALGALLICLATVCRGQQEIWQPATNATWQWQLQFQVNTSFDVDMYDIDLFGESVCQQLRTAACTAAVHVGRILRVVIPRMIHMSRAAFTAAGLAICSCQRTRNSRQRDS
ncbi:unnamed protein product [Ectocarpus sp. 4 AP-2014]